MRTAVVVQSHLGEVRLPIDELRQGACNPSLVVCVRNSAVHVALTSLLGHRTDEQTSGRGNIHLLLDQVERVGGYCVRVVDVPQHREKLVARRLHD